MHQTEQVDTPSPRALRASKAREYLREMREGKHKLTPRGQFVLEAIRDGADFPAQQALEAIGAGAFTAITLDVAHLNVMKGYAAIDPAWQQVCELGSAPDFKPQNVAVLSGQGTLPVVLPKQDYQEASVTDELRTAITLRKHGRIWSFSMEAMLNAETAELASYSREFGKAAGLTINSAVFSDIIVGNPTLWDSVALWSTTHNNDISGGAALALNAANIKGAIAKFGLQTGLASEPIAPRARYLVCGPRLELDALELLGAAAYVQSTLPTSGNEPGSATFAAASQGLKGQLNVIGKFLAPAPIVSSYITGTQWYLLADPNVMPLIRLNFLNGQQEPEIWSEPLNTGGYFQQDAMRNKARIVLRAQPVDYRSGVRGSAA